MKSPRITPGAVVVGVDGSECGQRALDWAIDQAVHTRRPLVLLHATGGLGTPSSAWLDEVDHEANRVLQAALKRGHELLHQADASVAALAPSVPVQTLVLTEDPREVLLSLAHQASMLCLGSRGWGPVRSLLLGSVSVSVARHAVCPVVVVRPHKRGTVRRGVLVGAHRSEPVHARVRLPPGLRARLAADRHALRVGRRGARH